MACEGGLCRIYPLCHRSPRIHTLLNVTRPRCTSNAPRVSRRDVATPPRKEGGGGGDASRYLERRGCYVFEDDFFFYYGSINDRFEGKVFHGDGGEGSFFLAETAPDFGD